MPEPVSLRTPRLLLRPWRESDREPFAELTADLEVMEYFPSLLSRGESDALVDRIQASFAERGWGPWAVEVLPSSQNETIPFIGYVGLAIPRFEARFTPCVEVAWRLRRSAWGQGYATEAARAAIEFGFEQLGLEEIVSFTATCNDRSWRVMQRLGMTTNPDEDFDHPLLPSDHRLCRHVLYRLGRSAGWSRSDAAVEN